MGALPGARSYREQHDDLPPLCHGCGRPMGAHAMTTDPNEGRRQIEAMQPPKLAVGDLVRLKAGGSRTMTVVAMEDYSNTAVCEWAMPYAPAPSEDSDVVPAKTGAEAVKYRDTFSARALIKVENGRQQVGQRPESPRQRQEERHAEQGDAVEAPTQG